MAVNKPTLIIQFLKEYPEETKTALHKYINNNLHSLLFKDEAGQTNDVLTLSILYSDKGISENDDRNILELINAKDKLGLLIGYAIPKQSNTPKDMNTFTTISDNATKIRDFIKNQALGVAHNIAGKYIPNFLVSSIEGKFTGQQPSNDTTLEIEEREAVLYSLGTFSINDIVVKKSTQNRTIEIECVTISSIYSMGSNRTRNFNGQTLADVASEIAIESGLSLAIHPDIADAPIETAQTHQTNQAYLRELCSNHNASFKVVNNILFINHRDATTNVSNAPLPEVVIDDGYDIISYTLKLSAGSKSMTGITIHYKNSDGTAEVAELVGDRSGYAPNNGFVYQSRETAIREANARLAQGTGSKESFQFTTNGAKLLTSDSKFTVKSKSKILNNRRFKVTSANYTFTNGNLRVSYNCEKI